MKIIGIVSEYNPFHNGHAYQLQKSVQDIGADGVVAMMSGNFVQRGTPALYDKWLRAELAVKAGVNLVIELPTYYATSSAESFARGAIELLNGTGVITHLSFGSELDALDILDPIAETLNNPSSDFNEKLNASLKLGDSYPVARSKALHFTNPELKHKIDLNQSNIILGIEYLKALKQINSAIAPYIVKRVGNNYNDPSLDSKFVSATAIRKGYFENPESFDMQRYVPKAVADTIHSTIFSATRIEDFQQLLFYALRKSTPSELSRLREVSEGLENKLYKSGMSSNDYTELTENLKSKRYTMTRINRILLNTLLGIEQQKMDLNAHGYYRVLAFDAVGQKIIRQIKKVGYHPTITNINKHSDYLNDNPLFQLDCRATDIYHLVQQDQRHRIGGRDYLQKPYKHE